jgi:hypothetical protein
MVVVAMLTCIIAPTALFSLILMDAYDAYTLLNMLILGTVMALAITGSVLLLRYYRPVWSDRYTTYDQPLYKVVQHVEVALEEAGLDYDHLEKAKVTTKRFDQVFRVRSEGFRIALMKDVEGITVYVGPMKDFNEKKIQMFMSLIDKYLWKPPEGW